MNFLSLPTSVMKTLVVELIAKAPEQILDDVVAAVCERLRRVDESERLHPSQVERAASLLGAFERVHLPAIIYDALNATRMRALIMLALDRFAIDGSESDVEDVAGAAERFVDAVRERAPCTLSVPRSAS